MAKIPRRLMLISEIIARAIVKFRSLAGALKIGTKECFPLCSRFNPTGPTNGKSPNQFEVIMKRKMVAMRGRYFSDKRRSPKTESMNFKICSSKSSKILWIFPGTRLIFLLIINPRDSRTKRLTIARRRAFVTGHEPMRNISSALSDISFMFMVIKGRFEPIPGSKRPV